MSLNLILKLVLSAVCFRFILTLQDSKVGTLSLSPKARAFRHERSPTQRLASTDVVLRRRRVAVRDPNLHWPRGRVPYEISSDLSQWHQRKIKEGIQELESKTCVRWTPHQGEANYVFFEPGKYCDSEVGMIGGRQIIELQIEDCFGSDTILHELMHAIGFEHEQQRPDRDQYIKVLYENIDPHMYEQFEIVDPSKVMIRSDWPYDYNSIMHYSDDTYARNDKPTMISINPPGAEFGIYPTFTELDIKKINFVYNCTNYSPTVSQSIGNVGCVDMAITCSALATVDACRLSDWLRSVCRRSCNSC